MPTHFQGSLLSGKKRSLLIHHVYCVYSSCSTSVLAFHCLPFYTVISLRRGNMCYMYLCIQKSLPQYLIHWVRYLISLSLFLHLSYNGIQLNNL